jgi:hypothetical protein
MSSPWRVVVSLDAATWLQRGESLSPSPLIHQIEGENRLQMQSPTTGRLTSAYGMHSIAACRWEYTDRVSAVHP